MAGNDPQREDGVVLRGGLTHPRPLPCEVCRLRPPSYDRLLARWAFDGAAREVIHGFKFKRLPYLGADLADELAATFSVELDDVDVVTAVPLHPLRKLSRGFDQAEAIARPLAARLGKPYARMLRRTRRTRAQVRQKRAERLGNLDGAFRLRTWLGLAPPVEGLHVLLVDDVVTTGATLEATSRPLALAGAHEITALAAAYTPDEHPASARPRSGSRALPTET